MSSFENGRVFFDGDASDLAFRAGQCLEKLLLSRGLERARSSQSMTVAADEIKAALDEGVLVELRRALDERAQEESRKVA